MLGFRALLVAACALAAPAFPQAPATPKPLPEDRATGAAEITAAAVRPWLEELTSPACAGRGTGTAGFARAATLMRDHFKSLGLDPAGDDGTYWQQVPWTQLAADPATAVLEVRKGDEVVARLTPGKGLCGYAATSADAEADLVLVTLGEDLDALAEADLAGKIALVVAPEAASSERIGRGMRDAAAWLRIDDQAAEASPSLSGQSRPGPRAANAAVRGRDRRPNSLVTTSTQLDAILAACGKQRSDADLREGTAIGLPDLHARLHIDVVESNAPAYNVIGILRGSDPQLADEYVVIGSHLDHLGTSRGRMYPGADDDGSGSAGVMAVARAFAKNPKPRRSILFVTFCGEEMGLIGSAYFTDHPPIPLSAIAAELQMDMIGRHEESQDEPASENVNSLHLIGTQKLSKDLHELCIARNEAHAAFDLEWDEEDVFSRSDHYNFARYGVPIAFFFTGFHPDYHRPSDTPDKIDFDKLARVARYVYDIAFELASADARPLVDPERWEQVRKEQHGRGTEQPAAPERTTRQSHQD